MRDGAERAAVRSSTVLDGRAVAADRPGRLARTATMRPDAGPAHLDPDIAEPDSRAEEGSTIAPAAGPTARERSSP